MLSDEDILAEFREEKQMEVDDDDDGNEDEQQEETPKRPTKSEARQAKQSRLSQASVCLMLREPRFDGKQDSCHSRSTKVLAKTKNNRTFKDFSMQQHLLIYPTYNYCIFM